jgi:hypothetical protein
MKLLVFFGRPGVSAATVSACATATAVVALATPLGCSRPDPTNRERGSAAPPAVSVVPRPKISGLVNEVPLPDEKVKSAVNPRNEAPYSGPVGSVRGTVTIKGDQAPELPELIAKISDKCKASRDIYGRLFREGLMRSAADVLVTVTGYHGYVPPKEGVVRVVGRDCAWDRLTVGMMFGQRLEVSSRGTEPYMPQLIGSPVGAMMVAVPGGAPVKLYPQKPGRYGLVDRIHLTMTGEVYVLKYPTFDVTGLDGRFEITGVPAGEVTLNAFLPSIGKTAEHKLKIEPGKTHNVDLEIVFDAKKDVPPSQPTPEAATKPAAGKPAGTAKKP